MKWIAKFFDLFVATVTIMILLHVGMFTVPQLFHVTPFVVRSGSMEPSIPTGSVVFVDRTDVEAEVGDVITFGLSTGEGKGMYVTHRVHKADDEFVQTKGDANNVPDGWLSRDAIMGKVVFYIPKYGFLLDKLQKNHGYAVVIIFICALNMLAMMFNEMIH